MSETSEITMSASTRYGLIAFVYFLVSAGLGFKMGFLYCLVPLLAAFIGVCVKLTVAHKLDE